MAIRLEDYIAKLPQEEQIKIHARAQELIEEEANLQELRMALHISQAEVAESLNIKQAAVSKLERRKDMYISTLQNFIEALGGNLEITASFPNQNPVKLTGFFGANSHPTN